MHKTAMARRLTALFACSFWTKDKFSLYIYAVPTSAHTTRLIINAWAQLPQNKILSFLRSIKPLKHLFRYKFDYP